MASSDGQSRIGAAVLVLVLVLGLVLLRVGSVLLGWLGLRELGARTKDCLMAKQIRLVGVKAEGIHLMSVLPGRVVELEGELGLVGETRAIGIEVHALQSHVVPALVEEGEALVSAEEEGNILVVVSAVGLEGLVAEDLAVEIMGEAREREESDEGFGNKLPMTGVVKGHRSQEIGGEKSLALGEEIPEGLGILVGYLVQGVVKTSREEVEDARESLGPPFRQ